MGGSVTEKILGGWASGGGTPPTKQRPVLDSLTLRLWVGLSKAARAAGMPCVFVPHSFMLQEGVPLAEQPIVRSARPTQAILSLTQFRPEDFGLPPMSSATAP